MAATALFYCPDGNHCVIPVENDELGVLVCPEHPGCVVVEVIE